MKLFQIILFLSIGFYFSIVVDSRLTEVDEMKIGRQIFPANDAVEVAREPAQAEIPQGSPNDIIAPVVATARDGDALVGAFAASSEEVSNPNELTETRADLNQQAKKYSVVNLKRFTNESFTFFVAIGAVTFNSMWIRSHGDPVAMERHIHSLKDPIAHISFYAFMQSQGIYMDHFRQAAKVKTLNEKAYKRLMVRLSYQGMAVGSIASSITSDLGQSVVMCTDQWIKGKKDEASLGSCSEAWKQWTVRKKVTQYFPTIITMWSSQAVSDLISTGASNAFLKIPIKKIGTQKLKNLAFKITGVDVAMTFIPGTGWFSKATRFLGKVTQISIFLTADQVMSRYTYRPLNNILLPTMSLFDFKKLNQLWLEADEASWNQEKLKKINPSHALDFVEEIEKYSENMRDWRNHLNQDVEMDLSGWMEMTKKLLYQESFSYKFYQEFLDSLFENLRVKHRIEIGNSSVNELQHLSGYPFRELPFYGVKTGAENFLGATKVNDSYLMNPNQIEQKQKEQILAIARKYKNKNIKILDQNDNQKYQKILQLLLSEDKKKMTQALFHIDEAFSHYSLGVRHAPKQLNEIIFNMRNELGAPYPVIYPFAGFSQAVAAHSSYIELDAQADYSLWSTKKLYKFNKTTDLMMYNIFCGGSQAQVRKFKYGVSWLSPEFVGPSLMRVSKRHDYCSSISTSTNLYNSTIDGKSLKDHFLKHFDQSAIADYKLSDEEFNTRLDSFDADIREALIPNKDKTKALQMYQQKKKFEKPFMSWWEDSTNLPLNKAFRDFDAEYAVLVKNAFDNFHGKNGFYKRFSDWYTSYKPDYYPAGIEKSLRAESSVYIQLINRALVDGDPEESKLSKKVINEQQKKENWSPAKFIHQSWKTLTAEASPQKSVDYIQRAGVLSKQNYAFYSLYSGAPKKSIRDLNALLNDYYKFVGARDNQFNAYIEHSKKIDTAINEILVAAGVMLKVDRPNNDFMSELAMSEVSAYTYVQAKPYQLNELKEKVIYFAEKIVNMVGSEITEKELKLQGEKYLTAVQKLEKALGKPVNKQVLQNIRNWYVKSINDLKAMPKNKLLSRRDQIIKSNRKLMDEFSAEINLNSTMTTQQKVIIASVQGLRQVESEIKRFIRMGMMLSNSLELDNQEEQSKMAQ